MFALHSFSNFHWVPTEMWQPGETDLPDLNIVDGPLLQLLNEDLAWLKDETSPPHLKQMRNGETQTQPQTQTMSECRLQVAKSTQTCFHVPKPWTVADPGLVAKLHQVSKGTQVQPKVDQTNVLLSRLWELLCFFSLTYTIYSIISTDPASWLTEKITQLFSEHVRGGIELR